MGLGCGEQGIIRCENTRPFSGSLHRGLHRSRMTNNEKKDKNKGGESGHDRWVALHHVDESGSHVTGCNDACEGEVLDLDLDLMDREKRRENDYCPADAPHSKLCDGRERGGREEETDEGLLRVMNNTESNGSPIDASVFVRYGIELEGCNARCHRQHIFEDIDITRWNRIMVIKRFPDNCSIRPIANTAMIFFLLKVVPTYDRK